MLARIDFGVQVATHGICSYWWIDCKDLSIHKFIRKNREKKLQRK